MQELTVHLISDLISNTILERLTYKDQSTNVQKPYLCLKLEIIALRQYIACSGGSIARMVESRTQAPVVPTTRLPSVARINVIEMFDNEPELEYLDPLRSRGLLLKLYSSRTGNPIPLDEGDARRLRKLQAGLELHTFNLSTGYFELADD